MSGNDKIKKFIENLELVKKNGDFIIILDSDAGEHRTTIVYLDYISDRWARGHSQTVYKGNRIDIPATINYGDIFSQGARKKDVEFVFPEYIDWEDK